MNLYVWKEYSFWKKGTYPGYICLCKSDEAVSADGREMIYPEMMKAGAYSCNEKLTGV